MTSSSYYVPYQLDAQDKALSRVYISPDVENVGRSVAEWIVKLSQECIERNGRFVLAVSGGSMPKILVQGLKTKECDYSKWFLFFSDERIVPLDSPDSNYNAMKETGFFFAKDQGDTAAAVAAIPKENIFPIDSALQDANACAEHYAMEMKRIWKTEEWPKFDLILLGMGPDGHTCSLFPNHPLLDEKTRWVAGIEDSPKLPPKRITLTLPVLNNADNIGFIACGASKAVLMPEMLELHKVDDRDPLPAAQVKPKSGNVRWYIDSPAATHLPKNKLSSGI